VGSASEKTRRNLGAVEPVTPSIGWGVLHLYYRVDRERAEREPGAAKRIVDAVTSLEADGHQALCVAVLGQKADFGVMALGPDLVRLHGFQHELATAPLLPAYSFVSLTEASEYTATEEDERARLEREEQIVGADADERLVAWRERMSHYREHRLHPKLPAKRLLSFYPMSKRREPGANWYELRFDERKALMAGHARVGRSYAGRILQLITGSTGLDDWEWGVTLLADDPVAFKDIVAEMRFDPVSARYADFGPFYTGLLLPVAEACARVGLRSEAER
jgi:hydrogen peroxide-dependent heme synthase